VIQALWIPSPFHWIGREGHQPRWLILHGTAGGSSAEAIARWFQNPNAEVSAHYVIGRDGVVVQCVRESDAAYANGALTAGHDHFWPANINPNLLTISIELVKPSTDNSDNLTEPQRASCFALVREICQRNGIPCKGADKDGGITGHYSIDPVNRSRCPGPYPWNELWSYLGANQKGGEKAMTGIPQGWKDDGKVLSANGFKVTDGFRQWILSHDWDPGNTPRMNAAGLNPVELGNPDLGSGTVQAFNKTILAWTPKMGVYEMYAGKEFLALHQELHQTTIKLNDALAQVKALQAQMQARPHTNVELDDLKTRLNQIKLIVDEL
jgi:N-acetyl-anhydromuramyl-L-alanine amidase AmpD